jgi:hypothetical protein
LAAVADESTLLESIVMAETRRANRQPWLIRIDKDAASSMNWLRRRSGTQGAFAADHLHDMPDVAQLVDDYFAEPLSANES